jgi:hypothetical protein
MAAGDERSAAFRRIKIHPIAGFCHENEIRARRSGGLWHLLAIFSYPDAPRALVGCIANRSRFRAFAKAAIARSVVEPEKPAQSAILVSILTVS